MSDLVQTDLVQTGSEESQPAQDEPNLAINPTKGPLDEPAGDWFVNRTTELAIFWKWASGIPHIGRNSYALIGLRRTGKSAILYKTFNRLFHEQKRILPVFVSFRKYLQRNEPINSYEFVDTYLSGYACSYFAFRYQLTHLLDTDIELSYLEELAHQYQDEIMLFLFKRYRGARYSELSSVFQLVHWAISLPLAFAKQFDLPAALMMDEFQVLTSVYNPDSKVHNDVTNGFQHISESLLTPMLVSGSSVSMMVGEALGGMLSGRFKIRRLRGLSQEHAIDMIYRLGKLKGIPITEELALAIWSATQGYPYPIECLLNSDSPAIERLPEIEALNEIVAFELTHEQGGLYEHYESEYGKYVRQLNGDQTTRKILLWIANHAGEIIRPHTVAEVFALDVLQVQDSLEKLYKIDVIERASISSFWGPADPLMREFLKYEHYLDIDNVPKEHILANLRQQLNAKQGEINRQAGHFTEIIVAGVLNNFDNRTVDGLTYFNHTTPLVLSRMEQIMRREGVMKAGNLHEMDVIGEYRLYNGQNGNAGLGAWLVSVRYQKRKMGVGDVEEFIQHAAALQAEKRYAHVTHWYFSKSGFSEAAMEQMRVEGIYFSDRRQFNALAACFGLLPLQIK